MRFQLILKLARKDWRLFWSDRRAALICFAVPVLLASAFGVIFHKPTPDAAAKLPVVIVVEDEGPFTHLVAGDLLTSPRFEATEVSRTEAEALVAERKAVAVVLSSGFEQLKNWEPDAAGEVPKLLLLHHPNASAERAWAEGVATEAVMKRMAREAFGAKECEAAMPFRVEAASVSPHPRTHFNSYSHSFCGMTLQYLLFWGMESGLLLLRERQRGVWVRVRAAAVPLWCILAGKALATAFIALLQVLVTFAVGYLAFNVTIDGSVIGFMLLAVAACGLASATGLFVAALGGSEARARSVSVLFILGISMLGGLWFPSFLLPSWVREIALALPTTWAMQGLEAVTWQGGGLWSALPGIAAVAGFTLVLLLIAALRLRSVERAVREGNS